MLNGFKFKWSEFRVAYSERFSYFLQIFALVCAESVAVQIPVTFPSNDFLHEPQREHKAKSSLVNLTKAHLFLVCTGLEISIRSRIPIYKQTHVCKQQSHVLTYNVGVEDIFGKPSICCERK